MKILNPIRFRCPVERLGWMVGLFGLLESSDKDSTLQHSPNWFWRPLLLEPAMDELDMYRCHLFRYVIEICRRQNKVCSTNLTAPVLICHTGIRWCLCCTPSACSYEIEAIFELIRSKQAKRQAKYIGKISIIFNSCFFVDYWLFLQRVKKERAVNIDSGTSKTGTSNLF